MVTVQEPTLFPNFQNTPVHYTRVRLRDAFWAPRQETVHRVSVPWAIEHLDLPPDASVDEPLPPSEGRHVRVGDYEAIKFIETLAAVSRLTDDSSLADTALAWSERFTADQEPNGYLPNLYPAGQRYGRWHSDWWSHEAYALGHFLDAAMELADASGRNEPLTAARAAIENMAVDLMDADLPYGVGCAGIEPALMSLYGRTGEPRLLNLCRWLVEQRGRHEGRVSFGAYAQDHVPVREQRTIEGHAVRAAYLYAGVAALVGATGDEDYLATLEAVWADMMHHKTYRHGAVGSRVANNEGYLREPNVLPLDDCYGESCSVYGNFQWSHDMFRLTGDAAYLDGADRMLYNAFAASLQLSGDAYFYENPAEQDESTVRPDWHPVPCCPPNILKLIAKVGGFFYATDREGVFVKHYGASEADVPIAGGTRFVQTGGYPWNGDISIELFPAEPEVFTVWARIPSWASAFRASVNGVAVDGRVDKGWLAIRRLWARGDRIDLDLPMDAVRTRVPEEFSGYEGLVAIERGPIVYCLEDQDLRYPLELAILPDDSELVPEFRPDFLGGVTVLHTTLRRRDGLMYRRDPLGASGEHSRGGRAILVPYAVWANRRPGAMRTWIPRVEAPLTFTPDPPEPGHSYAGQNPGLT